VEDEDRSGADGLDRPQVEPAHLVKTKPGFRMAEKKNREKINVPKREETNNITN
jgi:hypothetical protein